MGHDLYLCTQLRMHVCLSMLVVIDLLSAAVNCSKLNPMQAQNPTQAHKTPCKLTTPMQRATPCNTQVLPLGLIFFAASFNLTILQSLKDSIVVVAGGAETLVRAAELGALVAIRCTPWQLLTRH